VRLIHTDAELIAKEFANTFIPGQYVELDRYYIFIRLLENGVASTPFAAKTLPSLSNRHIRRRTIIRRTRERFAADRIDVERRLNRWIHDRDITVQRSARSL
jgi:hypothetical protein